MSRLVLFAHFDPGNRIRDHTWNHLRALKSSAAELRFASTSRLHESDIDKLKSISSTVLLLPNYGYDFEMWRALIRGDDSGETVLVNSSIFGPLYPLDPIFDRMSSARCDFWGMTENLNPTRHIQSYFIVLRKGIAQSEPFKRFMSSILPFNDKWGTISAYEIGLTCWLTQNGFVGLAAWPYSSLVQGIIPFGQLLFRRRNPAISFGTELLRLGMPYVKLELLRNGPWTHLPTKQRLSHNIHSARVRRHLSAIGVDFSDAIA